MITTSEQSLDQNLSRFGRKWSISVQTPEGIKVLSDNEQEDENVALRCTFEIDRPAFQIPAYSDISIYNISEEMQNLIFEKGSRVYVQAGYKNGPYGSIYSGKILQSILSRENVVDYKFTMHCVDGFDILYKNQLKKGLSKGKTQEDIVREVANSSEVRMPIQYITKALKIKTLPRFKMLWGDPTDILRDVAIENDCHWYVSDDTLTFGFLQELEDKANAIVYSPETGLIGSPQQTQEGVNFRILLDPRIHIKKPGMQIKLDNSLIRVQKKYVNQPPILLLDQDFYCMVGAFRHIGDTRGNDWYTDIMGLNITGRLMSAMVNNKTEMSY